MPLVAGVDSSTQSCKVLIVDAETGVEVRRGVAKHPDGTEVHPRHWWTALTEAIAATGGLADVAAISVGGQQHGMVCLDADGEVIRPALLWNDTRSAGAALDLIADLGEGDHRVGRRRWAEACGSVPIASLTVSKLRWLADHEPDNAARIATVCLPHDWLTWQILGGGLDALATDRSDASGTGWFDPAANEYRRDLLALALRRDDVGDIRLPRLLAADEAAGTAAGLDLPDVVVGPGCGDNAGAALGLGLAVGQVSVSLGTSGVAAVVSDTPTHDHTGMVNGFADASGRFLPLACTLNAARILDATARVLDVDHDELADLALSAEPGSAGLVHVPYLEGERTPNLPDATGSWHGLTLTSMTRPNIARAAFEGLACLMAEALDAVRALGVTIDRVTLVGGAARSRAVQEILPAVLGLDVEVPPDGEYVARGAARQAAWTLATAEGRLVPEPPAWPLGDITTCNAAPTPQVLTAYRHVRPWSAE